MRKTGKARDERLFSLAQAFTGLDDAAFVTDLEFHVYSWNHAATLLYKIEAEDALGRPLDELLSVEEPDLPFPEIRELLVDQGRWRGDAIHVTCNGLRIWVEWSLSSLCADDGRTLGYVSIVRDISARKGMEDELEFADQAYLTLAEASTTCKCILRNDHIVYANSQLAQLLGRSPQEMIGTEFEVYVDPNERPRMNDLHAQYVSGARELGMFETLLVHRDGSPIPVELNGNIIPRQSVPTILISVNDIRERKRMAAALSEVEKLYWLLAENVTDVIWTTDLNLNVNYISPSVERARGFTQQEAQAQGLEQRFTPESAARVLQVLTEEIELEQSGRADPQRSRLLELEQFSKNGDTTWVELKASFLRDEHGRAVGLLGVTRDISERRRIEQQRLASEAYYRTLIENISDLITIVGPDGVINYLSPATERVSGYKPEELVRRYVFDFVHPDNLPHALEVFNQALAEPGSIKDVEISFVHKNGSVILLAGKVRNMLADPLVNGLVINVHDMTEKRVAQTALRESEERYRAIFKTSSDAVMLLEGSGFIDCNPATVELFGFSDKRQLLGLHPAELSPPRQPDGQSSLDGANKRIAEAFDKGYTRFEWTHLRGREEFLADVRLSVLEIKQHKVLQAVVRDITTQQRNQQELRLNEQRMRRIYKSLAVPTYTWRFDGEDFVLLDFNDAAEKITGGKISELVGIKARRLYADQAGIVEDMGRCFTEGETFSREMDYLYQTTGEAKRLLTTYVKVPPDLVMVHTEDVTERRQHQQQLQAAVVNSPIPTLVVDSTGKIVTFNTALEQLTGYSLKQIPDVRAWADRLYPDENYRQVVHNDINRLIDGRELTSAEYTITCRDGARRVVDLRFSRFGNGFVVQLIDVTERRAAEWNLLVSEERYRGLVEGLQDVVYQTDELGHFTYVNKIVENITGYAVEELVGRHFLDVVKPENRRQVDQFFRRQYSQRIANTYFEFPIISKSGRELWIGQNAQLIMVGGRPRGFQAMARDITTLKNAENAIRSREQRYRLLADNVTDFIWTMDLNLRFTYVSPSVKRLFGYSPEEFARLSIDELFDAQTAQQMRVTLAHELELEATGQAQIGQPMTMETVLLRKDGTPIYTESRNSFLRDASGQPTGVLGLTRDITERKLAEEALRESEETARTLLNATGCIAVLLSPDGRIIGHNREFAGAVDQPNARLVGRNAYELMPPDVAARRRKVTENVVSTRESLVFQEDRGERQYENEVHPVLDARGQVARVAVFGYDVTERLRAENELREALRKSQEADLLKSRFMGNITHEFRTPLNAIIGFSTLMQMMPEMSQADRQRYLEQVKNNGQSLLQLTDSVLDMASVQAGRIEPRSIEIDLPKMLDRLCRKYALQAEQKGLEFQCPQIEGLPERLLGDPVFIERVLNNLVDNAIKFTGQGWVRLEFEAEREEAGVLALHFQVRDTGIGIDADKLELIFQPFFQIDDSMTRAYEGTGIGLSIARELAEMLGGAVWAESTPGQGSAFHFTCLLAEADPGAKSKS